MVYNKIIKVIIEQQEEENIGSAEEYLLEVLESVNAFDHFHSWIGGLIVLNKYTSAKARNLLIDSRSVVNEERTVSALKQLDVLDYYVKEDTNGILYAVVGV